MVVLEEVAHDVGGQSEHGADGKVDVSSDEHQRLADAEQCDERCAAEQLLDAVRVDEVVVAQRGRDDDDRDQQDEADLARTQNRQHGAAGRPALRNGRHAASSAV